VAPLLCESSKVSQPICESADSIVDCAPGNIHAAPTGLRNRQVGDCLQVFCFSPVTRYIVPGVVVEELRSSDLARTGLKIMQHLTFAGDMEIPGRYLGQPYKPFRQPGP
jgi:hypothetical protein